MDKMIAFCGLTCTECPTFIATRKDDDEERKKVAELWSKERKKISELWSKERKKKYGELWFKEYDSDIKPEDINCDGCLSEGDRLFNYCKVCEIRKCGKEKGVKNCTYCDDYACEKLNKLLKMVSEAEAVLEEVRKNL